MIQERIGGEKLEVRSRDNSRMFALRRKRKRNGTLTHVNRTVLVFLNIGDVIQVREKLLMSQRGEGIRLE